MRVFPILTSVIVAGALTFGFSQSAQAAVIEGAITGVTVAADDGSTSPSQNSQLTTTIDWCVPNGTEAGDTFTLTLSSHLDDLPLGFSLDDPKTGAEVASAVLSQTSPAVITFTMTSYAATHLNTCGSAYVRSGFNSSTTPTGSPTPLTSTDGSGRTFTTTITPTGVIGNRADAIKYGSYTRADQGRVTAQDFLRYRIDTPVGPFDSATTVDTVPVGQDWTFDCSTIAFGEIVTDANFDYVSSSPATPASTCTSTSLTVNWGALPALHYGEIAISVSLPAPTGVTAAPERFENTAEITTLVGGVPATFSAAASNVQSSAGGVGSGTAIAVAPTQPTPSPTSPAPTGAPQSGPAPTVTTAPAAVTAVAATERELAYTGSNAALPLGAAGAFVFLGFGLIVVARRRSAKREQ